MITRTLMPEGYYLYRPIINLKVCRPEWNSQVDMVSWVREYWPDDARLMFHPVNEGDISPQYRQRQIKAGLLSGVPDLIFLLPGREWGSAAIEMKRDWWRSKPSQQQIDFLSLSAASGTFSAVCNGADAAKFAFLDYKLGLDRTA